LHVYECHFWNQSLFKNFSLFKIWTFSQSKSCENSIWCSIITEWVFQFICLRCSNILLESFLHVCFPRTMHRNFYNKSYRPPFYYRILEEHPFVLLWIYLICYLYAEKCKFYVDVFTNRKFFWRRIKYDNKPRYTIINRIIIWDIITKKFFVKPIF